MQTILIIGAGRSSSSLISYLLECSSKEDYKIRVADASQELARQKIAGAVNGTTVLFDVTDEIQREEEIKKADLIISMLPASLHFIVALDCLKFGKHFITASYVSKEIRSLDAEVKQKGLLFLNEMGLDPGIDHMSAMKIIDRIKAEGGRLMAFKSYCGGLISPESNDNPWGYKFTWNPRNVVLAGQGTAQYIENGRYKYIPYNRIFASTERINIEGYGSFEAYPNRDSLSYRIPYGLEEIPTILRGTLRAQGFCKAWDAFVKLGFTEDNYKITDSDKLMYSELTEAYLPKGGKGSLIQRLTEFLGEESENTGLMQKIKWTGITSAEKIRIADASPAQILQDLLEEKWKLKKNDKDRVVMFHRFIYTLNESEKEITSSLVIDGRDEVFTAMSQTVGLPMAIAAKRILCNQIKSRGVIIPTVNEIYEPVLKELENLGIRFVEKQN